MPNVSAEISVLQEQMKVTTKTLERIEGKLDDLDKKFAAKWVQTVVAGLVAAILLGFIGVIVAFFIPHQSNTTTGPSSATTTTTNTPTGSTSTTRTTGSSGTAGGTNATANAKADTTKPSDSQTSNGGVTIDTPKVQL